MFLKIFPWVFIMKALPLILLGTFLIGMLVGTMWAEYTIKKAFLKKYKIMVLNGNPRMASETKELIEAIKRNVATANKTSPNSDKKKSTLRIVE